MKEDLIETLKDLGDQIIVAIFDALEEAIDIFTISSGKRVYQVLYVTVGFLVVSILCQLIKIPIFISWKEALVSVVFMSIVSIIELYNQGAINKFKDIAIKKMNNVKPPSKQNKQKKEKSKKK